MEDLWPGSCLCCNTPVTYRQREWAAKEVPAVVCSACLRLIQNGAITVREMQMLYTIRSQLGWCFQQISILNSQMESLTASQTLLERTLLE